MQHSKKKHTFQPALNKAQYNFSYFQLDIYGQCYIVKMYMFNKNKVKNRLKHLNTLYKWRI